MVASLSMKKLDMLTQYKILRCLLFKFHDNLS